MKIIFAGTPEFAAIHLKALLTSQHEICAVYTQPDKPQGRGRQWIFSPVKQIAIDHHIPIYQPITLRDKTAQEELIRLNADLMVVVAYGLLLPETVLIAPKYGCINVHASLLPRWRGAAPIQRAILAGDKKTGVTIMQMAKGLDTGDMLHVVSCAVENNDTSETLHDRLAQLGATALLDALELLEQGKLTPVPQDETSATYAEKLTKAEANVDWSQSAEAIARAIRAYNPWPVAFTFSNSQQIRLWQAEVVDQNATMPGEIMALHKDSIDVSAGEKQLRITQIQLPGGKVMSVRDVLNGKKWACHIGDRFSYDS